MLRNASEGVIRVCGRNPHYFEYKGKEILLITSAEHYGAVISANFDYIKYFDALHEYGLNYTRIYPGAIVEPEGMWLVEDTMAPGANLIAPWARSGEPGYIGGGNKFDLSEWDPAYFARLRGFVAEAGKRGIIVEICFYNCMNRAYIEYSPLYKNANIQGVGDYDHISFQTLDDEALVSEQLRYMEKIITETNEYDNVIYEIIDEPTLTLTPSRKVSQWIERHIEAAIALEERLPKKHMIAQQLEIGVDFAGDDRVALIVTQYIGVSSRQIGGLPALNNCYCFNKPIELNETAYVPSWYDREHESISRLESWEFMVGGGAGFNQLNGYFVPSNPAGINENNKKILAGFRNLRAFLESFHYVGMTRDGSTVKRVSIGASVNMMSEKGKQYAMYMHHSFPQPHGFGATYYEPAYGEYEPTVTLALPAGAYNVTFYDPLTMNVLGTTRVVSGARDSSGAQINPEPAAAEVEIKCPRYKLDIAIKIVA